MTSAEQPSSALQRLQQSADALETRAALYSRVRLMYQHEAERFFPLDEYIRPRYACSLAVHCGLALGLQSGMLCSSSP